METILVDLPQFKQMHERIKELEAEVRALKQTIRTIADLASAVQS